MATRRFNNRMTVSNIEIPRYRITLTDGTNSYSVTGRTSIVAPTDLTLPETWVIPSDKKLVGWRQGDYEYRPGRAIPISQIDVGKPIEAVYINCLLVEFFDPETKFSKMMKFAPGALVTDFLKVTNYNPPHGFNLLGVKGIDGFVCDKIFISKSERLTFVWEKSKQEVSYGKIY